MLTSCPEIFLYDEHNVIIADNIIASFHLRNTFTDATAHSDCVERNAFD